MAYAARTLMRTKCREAGPVRWITVPTMWLVEKLMDRRWPLCRRTYFCIVIYLGCVVICVVYGLLDSWDVLGEPEEHICSCCGHLECSCGLRAHVVVLWFCVLCRTR